MSFLTKLFSKGASDLLESGGKLIDNISTSDQEKLDAKANLTKIVLSALNTLQNAQRDVMITEMKGNWLQKSWRPLTMLTFVVLLVLRWTGLATHDIPKELEMKLMDIIQLGLGGYVIGRSAEKISNSVTKNIDLTFLKKKNRNLDN